MVENKYKHAPTIMLSRNGDEAGEIRNLQSYRCPMLNEFAERGYFG